MNKHWRSDTIIGAAVVYDFKRWIVHSWDKKTRVLTLIDMYYPNVYERVIDPYFLQYDR